MDAGERTQVYRGLDRRYSTPVVVKLLDLRDADDEQLRRFELGLRKVELIGHPNVMPITAQGISPDGRKWIAMPLATGSLADFMTAVGRSSGSVADVMRQVAAGLQVAHKDGVVHGDIKPQNILRRDDGAWALTDFCLPPSFSGDERENEVFMAPEFLKRPTAPTVASDVFSLGRVLQLLTTGAVSTDTPPAGHIFTSVVKTATNSSPDSRYATVRDFATAINGALTATQEIKAWADVTAAAAELRERAMGRATPPEELYRILEWAERLDEDNEHDMRALVRVIPWLNDRALETLVGQDSKLFERVFETFSRVIQDLTFEPERCEEFADFGKRAIAASDSSRVFGAAVMYMAAIGAQQQLWRVRDVLVELLTHVSDPESAEAAVTAIKALDRNVARWSVTEFVLRAMPPVIREALHPWLYATGQSATHFA